MICLRCGYCCKHSAVIVVKDPNKGLGKDNLQFIKGDGTPCPHLKGNKPGKYRCAVHNKRWYKQTPCFSHGQIEHKPNTECRMGRYILDQEKTYAIPSGQLRGTSILNKLNIRESIKVCSRSKDTV